MKNPEDVPSLRLLQGGNKGDVVHPKVIELPIATADRHMREDNELMKQAGRTEDENDIRRMHELRIEHGNFVDANAILNYYGYYIEDTEDEPDPAA